jgi:putative transposase
MSRRGNCWDNAVAESFFGTLKTELIYLENFVAREDAKTTIVEWIEVFYNPSAYSFDIKLLFPCTV